MNIVGYGGGTNSTAMLIGLYHRKIPVDLILFSNTGGEQPHTYDYLPIMDRWLAEHGLPGITQVEYTDKYGNRLTLEQECLRSGTLPVIAYGYKKCSLKHKVGPQDKFCNHYPPCREVWARGERIVKFIGFDVGEQRRREPAQPIDNLIRYGAAGGGSGFAGSDVSFIGADGFCSPIGEHWRNVVTSEFGNRRDPFTGERRGHTGMDLAVPTGTSVRAALPGTVTVSAYNRGGYGYYVMIDHGSGLSTLYGHNSQLLARVGQTVEAGDVIALSGSTGRSTGPHLHFEVRINGERTNPRSYLP